MRWFFASVLGLASLLIPALASAGSAAGSVVAFSALDPGWVDSHEVTMLGGQQARISVRGRSKGNLDCFVYDEEGYVIASDTSAGDTCQLKVTPRWTGAFRVEVRNVGEVYDWYVLRTN